MGKILVSGLVNLETTLRVDGFPLDYDPVRYPFFGVRSTISGVGFNIAKALTVLGNSVHLACLVGEDLPGRLARLTIEQASIPTAGVISCLAQTAQSVILYETSGRRQIHVDLKDIQEQSYPEDMFHQALQNSQLVVLCNVNYSRPFLHQVRQAGIPLASDVHAVASLEDEYNQDFMAAADILFLSHERLPVEPEEFARRILECYRATIVVIGLGAQGALLALRGEITPRRFPAVATRLVVNTIGAGDALFSSFLHFYLKSGDPVESIHRAQVFASYKIGAAGAADGFLNEDDLALLPAFHLGPDSIP